MGVGLLYYSVTSSRTISTVPIRLLVSCGRLGEGRKGRKGRCWGGGGGKQRTNVIIEPDEHPAEFLVAFHHDPDARADAFVN